MSTRNYTKIIGNVGQTPELKYTSSNTAFLNISLAVNERYKDKDGKQQTRTTWLRGTIWGKRAEGLSKIIEKGQLIAIIGKLTSRTVEVGEKRMTTVEISIDDVDILSRSGVKSDGYGNRAEDDDAMDSASDDSYGDDDDINS